MDILYPHLSSSHCFFSLQFLNAGDDLVNLQVDLQQPTFGDSFLALQNDTNTTSLRKTHGALRICNDELGLLGLKIIESHQVVI